MLARSILHKMIQHWINDDNGNWLTYFVKAQQSHNELRQSYLILNICNKHIVEHLNIFWIAERKFCKYVTTESTLRKVKTKVVKPKFKTD